MFIDPVAPFIRPALNLRWRGNTNERSQHAVTEASHEFPITAWKAKPPFSLQRRDVSSIDRKSLFSRELNVFDLHGSPLAGEGMPDFLLHLTRPLNRAATRAWLGHGSLSVDERRSGANRSGTHV